MPTKIPTPGVKRIKILYVCLGNICRSPIAEGTMEKLIKEKNLSNIISVDSAGTADYHIGNLPDRRTRQNAENHHLILTHKCRQIHIQDFLDFDYIVAMDSNNLADIQLLSLRAFGIHQSEESCFLLRKFDPEGNTKTSVPDPYYGDQSDFEEVFQIVNRSNEQFLDWLIEKHHFKNL
ncbi:MAG: low molecular weight protein-tyrosine-phosphatase [Bacteroidota bacterium]